MKFKFCFIRTRKITITTNKFTRTRDNTRILLTNIYRRWLRSICIKIIQRYLILLLLILIIGSWRVLILNNIYLSQRRLYILHRLWLLSISLWLSITLLIRIPWLNIRLLRLLWEPTHTLNIWWRNLLLSHL